MRHQKKQCLKAKYEGGIYNVSVTVYYLDNLKKYMSNENNVLLYDKSKANHEEASGSLVPSLSNDSPYFENIVTQNQGNVNNDEVFSTKPNNPIREEVSDYIGSSAHVQSVIKTIDKRYRLAGKKKLNEKSIQSFANKILSQTNSKYSKEQLTERLTALFVINPKTCKYN